MILQKRSKTRNILFVLLVLVIPLDSIAQELIEDLIVETYYLSNADDTLSVIPGQTSGLVPGMVTYRVFLDLAEGVQVTSIFGNENHELLVKSSDQFFNNLAGQPTGHSIVELGFSNFPETLLDSYLSFGAATGTHLGVPKISDPDASLYPDGVGVVQILTNQDPSMGQPITESDGLVSVGTGQVTTPPGFLVNPSIDSLRAVFGNTTARTTFSSDSVYFGDSSSPSFALTTNGVSGSGDENIILIGQFTTLGELEFRLNLTVIDTDGEEFTLVADDTNLQVGEIASPFLSYPQQCGCTDPDFFEFDPIASCDDNSCENLVVLGCGDKDACNFNPSPYLNAVEDLCCYGPDDCGELDITLACPDFVKSLNVEYSNVDLFPNPASTSFLIQSDSDNIRKIEIYSLNGQIVYQRTLKRSIGVVRIPTNDLQSGIYLTRIYDMNANHISRKLVITN